MVKPVLGYWKRRGLCEPIRYLLHYKNVDFEDYRIPVDGETWSKMKNRLGLDFPNLPYYIDENVKLTQSTTILRYLAEKYDLSGKTETAKIRVSLVEQQLVDIRTNFFNFVFNPTYEALEEDYVKKTEDELRLISEFLGDRSYLAGDELTYVDFIAFEVMDFLTFFSKNILDKFPTLKAYKEKIKNLPELKKYRNSSKFCAWPIVGPHNTWGQGAMPE